MATEGLTVAELLQAASLNATWLAEHGEELQSAVEAMTEAWAALQKLAQGWEQVVTANDEGDEKSPTEGPLVKAAQPLLALGLTCAALVVGVRGRRPFDLFSPDVHSRSEVALAFTIASFVSLSLASGWRIQLIAGNPLALYVVQLVMCFLSTTSTVPIVVGGNRGAPRWLVFASLGVVLWFGVLWLVSDASILLLPHVTRDAWGQSWDAGVAIVVGVLGLLLLGASCWKAAYALGVRRCCAEPFYERHESACAGYLRARLRPPAPPPRACSRSVSASTTEGSVFSLRWLRRQLLPAPGACPQELQAPPLYVPTALLASVFLVGALTLTIAVRILLWSFRHYAGIHAWVLDYLSPLQPLFELAGSPLPLEDVDFALERSQVCFVLAICSSTAFVAWLLCATVLGYRRVFLALMRGQAYQGKSLVERHGPGVFHAKWGTYLAGALVGNCLMAFGVIGFLVFFVSLLVSLGQSWALIWSAKDYWIFYGLLYCTRYAIFRWVIPRYVVTDDGVVVRRRVWALLFPTLMLLNFIVGATSGILRSLVLFPFMLVDFFRVDVTFLPDFLVDWDWSFHPFLSLVLHAHTRLNPVMYAVVTELARSCRPAPFWPTSARRRREGAGAGASAPLADPLAEPGEAEVEAEAAQPDAELPCRSPGQRACSRWYLAVTLARNPSLRPLRAPALAAARAAAEAETAAAALSEWPGPVPCGGGGDGQATVRSPPRPPAKAASAAAVDLLPLAGGGCCGGAELTRLPAPDREWTPEGRASCASVIV